MSDCQNIHELMVDALYDVLADEQKAEFDTHLQSCLDCARQYQQMAETLRIMSARETVESDEAFWTAYSERLVEHLESEYETPLRIRRPIRHPHFAWRISAVAALLMVGIFLGKWVWTDEQPDKFVSDSTVSAPNQADAEKVLVDDRVQAYFQKSQVLLRRRMMPSRSICRSRNEFPNPSSRKRRTSRPH
jgi:anti-sigma factor RsiW